MNLAETLDLLDFPAPARAALITAANELADNTDFSHLLNCSCEQYRQNGTLDYEALAKRAGQLAKSAGVAAESGTMLFFLALCPSARGFYRAEGRDDALFRATFSDLALKCAECQKVRGVWGDMSLWFGRFFDRTRFLLGRLEFEDSTLAFDFPPSLAGEPAINVHIPECGPLGHDECLASYRMAAREFSSCVRDGKALFVCSSWLLAAELRSFLPPTSNILRFANDYKILHVRKEAGFPDGWRIFADKWQNTPDALPRDTALQQGYADWLLTHTHTTVPYGAFLLDTATGEILQ